MTERHGVESIVQKEHLGGGQQALLQRCAAGQCLIRDVSGSGNLLFKVRQEEQPGSGCNTCNFIRTRRIGNAQTIGYRWAAFIKIRGVICLAIGNIHSLLVVGHLNRQCRVACLATIDHRSRLHHIAVLINHQVEVVRDAWVGGVALKIMSNRFAAGGKENGVFLLRLLLNELNAIGVFNDAIGILCLSGAVEAIHFLPQRQAFERTSTFPPFLVA